jgi:hypothetical protein
MPQPYQGIRIYRFRMPPSLFATIPYTLGHTESNQHDSVTGGIQVILLNAGKNS